MSKSYNLPGLGFFTETNSNTSINLPGVGFLSYQSSLFIPTGGVDYEVYSVEAGLARDWIETQYQSFDVDSGCTIDVIGTESEVLGTFARIGNAGNIIGTFSLQPPLPSTPITIEVDSPAPATVVVSGYTGVIGGKLNTSVVGSGAQFQVQGFILTDVEYLQWTASVASDYTFTGSANGQGGEWILRCINVSSGSTEIQPYWDVEVAGFEIYDNMFSEYWKVTDIPYKQESKRLSTQDIWNHDTTSGSTFIKIVDSADVQFARWNTRTGLVRSYVLDSTNSDWSGGEGAGFEERGYVYDNALAILALAKPNTSTTQKIRASQIANALVRNQDSSGAWAFSQNHMSVLGADKYFRSGAIAWAAYACLKTWDVFSFATANTSADQVSVRSAGGLCLDYLLTLIRPEYGTLSGGSGTYTSGVFSESAVIPWHSTEHNIDAWYAFQLGAEIFDNNTYAEAANGIITGLLEHHWDSTEGRFWQGIGSDGIPDSQGALDVHTWGSILLKSHRSDDRIDSIWPRITSNYAVDFMGQRGYKPYSPLEGYPGAEDALWAEGTFGEIYAKQMHGKASVSSLGGMITFQESSGAFAYSINRSDLTYEINSYESLASTAWFLLVAEQDQFIWNESPFEESVDDWLREQLALKSPILNRVFTIGSSNYVDRVIKWPTFNRSVDKTKPVTLSIPLANDDKALNYIVNSDSLLNTDCTLSINAVDSYAVVHSLNLFKGTIESVSQSGGKLNVNLMDRFKGFGESIIGDTTSGGALQFVDSNHLPGDLLWTMITSYGGLDNTKSSTNPDINYKSFTNWANIFEGDNIRLNAKFTGQKMIDIMTKFSDLLDSSFTFENNKLRFYRGSVNVSSLFISVGDSNIIDITVSKDDKKIINKQLVSGGWSVDSSYYTVNVTEVDTVSQGSFGIRESKVEDNVLWFVDSASAKNLAERYIFKQKNPLLEYNIKGGLGSSVLLMGDGLHFSDSQLDVDSSTSFYIEGLKVDLDTGETVIKTRNMPQLDSFILDVDTYSVLDQDYNYLL
jgi:hypothetical protein